MRHHLFLLLALITFLDAGFSTALAKEAPPAEEAAEEESVSETSEEGKEEETEQEAETKKPKRKTLKVEPKLIRVKTDLDGAFVADKMEEISLKPEEWSTFKIEEVVPHGEVVQEGTTLVRFENKQLLDAIADLELDLHLSEQRLMRTEEEMPRKEESLERQLADAEESLRRAEEDYQSYKQTERQQTIDSANMSLKMSKFYLDYYKDELEQLEKMYEADDLTEETEEIVLRRQRFMVNYQEFYYGMSKYYHQRTMEKTVPRRDRDIEESMKRTKDRLEQARLSNQVDPRVARYELEKQKKQRKKSLEKHVKLLADKSWLSVKSPAAGKVFYGEATDGKWTKLAEMRKKLLPGKTVAKDTILMTVVDSSSLHFLAKIDEKLLISVKEGQSVEIQPTVEGSDPIIGAIASISAVPVAAGKFELKVDVSDSLPDWLLPGFSGKASLVTYEKKDALLVPQSAVHKDELTDDEFVWIVNDDEVTKGFVRTGRKKGKQVEITSGLKADDLISLEDEEKKS